MWQPRAPEGRCNVVHLHPLDFAFQFLQTTIHAHYCIESDTETPPDSEKIEDHLFVSGY